MRTVTIIIWKDLQVAFAGRQRWLRMFVLPMLAIYLIGLGAQSLARGFTPTVLMDVFDEDASPASQALLAAIGRGHESLALCGVDAVPVDREAACALEGAALSPGLAEAHLSGGTTAAMLVIPHGFGAALAEGRPVTLAFTVGSGLVAPEIAYAAVHNAAMELAGPIIAADKAVALAASLGISADAPFHSARLADARSSWNVPPIRVAVEVVGSQERAAFGAQVTENGFRLSTPSIAAMFVMISLLNMAQLLTEERTSGVLRRMGMMPVRKLHLLAGHLLSSALMGWGQFAVMLGFGAALGVSFGARPWLALAVAAAYALAIAALAVALATVARTPGQALALATLAWVVLTPLGGGWWPLLLVPDWMRAVGHLSPVAWCLDALNVLVFGDGTWMDVVRPIGVLLLFAVAFFLIGTTRLDFQQAGSNDAGFGA